MKHNRQIFIFTLVCAMLIVMMSFMPLPADAYAVCDSAKAAVVIDCTTGEVLYEHDSDMRLPMASTTKIMSAMLALESGALDEEFTVDSEAIKVEGSSMGLQEGDIVTMRDLVCGMLLPSGNDAANAAAVRICGSTEKFVQLMNERAVKLGLENTHFVTPSGLDDDTDEHYSTAHDMARLAAAAIQNQDFVDICSQRYIKLDFGNPPYERWLTNTNKLLDNLDGVIGVKTGFTDKARRCLVSACERNGAKLICVTLNDPDDWKDHAALYEKCFAKMKTARMPNSGKEYKIKVAGGECSNITAVAAPLDLVLPEDCEKKLTAKVLINRFIPAPVKKGEQVGEVRYYYDGKLIKTLAINAVEDCAPYKRETNEWKKLLGFVEDYLENNRI